VSVTAAGPRGVQPGPVRRTRPRYGPVRGELAPLRVSTSAWWTMRSITAAATAWSPNAASCCASPVAPGWAATPTLRHDRHRSTRPVRPGSCGPPVRSPWDSQSVSWALKSAGEVNVRPGMDEVSNQPLRRSTGLWTAGPAGAAAPAWWPGCPWTRSRPRRGVPLVAVASTINFEPHPGKDVLEMRQTRYRQGRRALPAAA